MLALRRGLCHIACVHLPHPDGGFSTDHVAEIFGPDVAAVTFAHRRQGILLPPGNPRRLSTLEQAIAADLRWALREPGTGTRALFDRELDRLGGDAAPILRQAAIVDTHLEVGLAVYRGDSDIGMGIEAAAQVLGLDFLPIQEERFDLVIQQQTFFTAAVQNLLALLSTPGTSPISPRSSAAMTSRHQGRLLLRIVDMAKQLTWILGLIAALMITSGADAADRLKLSSTTSTDNTGLLAYLLPKFTAKTGLRVDVIAVGTGKALTLAENGDVDVTLVHAPSRERAFVEAGHGVNHRMVMANYFIIVGPEADPAQAGKAEAAEAAFERIAQSQAPFISRGDASGTHTKEQAIWKALLGAPPTGQSWYLESGKGMGETLTIADEKRGYTLSDSGTFLKYADKVDLKILFRRPSDLLYNPYGIIAVNPARHPHVNYFGAMQLIGFLTSPEGQKLIGDFKDKLGNQLFEPLAVPRG